MLHFNPKPNPGFVTITQPLKGAKSGLSPRRLTPDTDRAIANALSRVSVDFRKRRLSNA
jgi:hypothetical protein